MTTEEKYTELYMRLYKQAENLFMEYNLCQPHMDGTCIRTRLSPNYSKTPQDRCCGGCKYHDPEQGCTTISLACKIWLCGFVRNQLCLKPDMRPVLSKLTDIQIEMELLPIEPGVRESMEDTLASVREREDLIWIEDLTPMARRIPMARRSVSRGA